MLNLRRNRSYALLVKYCQFRRRRPSVEPTASTVVADSAVVVVNSVVIDIVNNVDIHVVNGAVVVEHTSVPISSLITAAHVTESVIDSAIEADVRTPVSVMPAIGPANERPIRRRPERADIGSNHPCAGNPIISRGSVSPVTGCPYIVVAGAFWLAVIRQRRRWLLRLDRLLSIVGVARVIRVSLIVALVRRRGLGLRRRLLRGDRLLYRCLRFRLLSDWCEIGLRRI